MPFIEVVRCEFNFARELDKVCTLTMRILASPYMPLPRAISSPWCCRVSCVCGSQSKQTACIYRSHAHYSDAFRCQFDTSEDPMRNKQAIEPIKRKYPISKTAKWLRATREWGWVISWYVPAIFFLRTRTSGAQSGCILWSTQPAFGYSQFLRSFIHWN